MLNRGSVLFLTGLCFVLVNCKTTGKMGQQVNQDSKSYSSYDSSDAEGFVLLDCEQGKVQIKVSDKGVELKLDENSSNTLYLPYDKYPNRIQRIKLGAVEGSHNDEFRSLEGGMLSQFFYVKRSNNDRLVIENWKSKCNYGKCEQGDLEGRLDVGGCQSKMIW